MHRAQIILGWTLVTAFAGAAAVMVDHREHVRWFQAAWLVGFAGYGLVLHGLWTAPGGRIPGRWRTWLAGFILLRLALLHTVPSDDLHRYVWEGKVQRYGVNPYAVSPDDDALVVLRECDPNWVHINHPDYPAIYPPVAQLLFRLVSYLGSSVHLMKVVFVALDVACVALFGAWLRRSGDAEARNGADGGGGAGPGARLHPAGETVSATPQYAAVYALCPLVLASFGIEGHLDSLMLFWLVLAGVLLDRRQVLAAGAAMGLAIGSKLVCVVLLPWWALRNPRAAAMAVVVAAATYVPFMDAGPDLLTSLTRFAGTSNRLGLFDAVLREAFEPSMVRWLCTAGLIVFVANGLRKRESFAAHATRVLAGMVLFLPVVHFWYLTWFLAFALARLRASWIILAAAMAWYFDAELPRATGGEWTLPPDTYRWVYAPFVVAWLAESIWRRTRRSRPATPAVP